MAAKWFEAMDTGGGLFPSGTDFMHGLSGLTGIEASQRAARVQAEQFNRVFDLYQPFVNAGNAQIDPLKRGASAGGYMGGLGALMQSPQMQAIQGERMKRLQGNLSATGMRRSGFAARQAASIPMELAQGVEGQLNSRSQALYGIGEDGMRRQSGALNAIGQAYATGALGAQQATAQGQGNLMGIVGSLLGAFSDIRLKTNVVIVGFYGPLAVIRWTWNAAANAIGLFGEGVGFIAQQVAQVMPEAVGSQLGYLTVNYEKVMNGPVFRD